MKPVALEKAESLINYAKSQGAKPSTFMLILKDEEGLELIDWLREENADNELLALDVEAAHKAKNPWPVLQYFQLLGLDMARLEALN